MKTSDKKEESSSKDCSNQTKINSLHLQNNEEEDRNQKILKFMETASDKVLNELRPKISEMNFLFLYRIVEMQEGKTIVDKFVAYWKNAELDEDETIHLSARVGGEMIISERYSAVDVLNYLERIEAKIKARKEAANDK